MFCSVQRIPEVRDDPQALANDYVVPLDHPVQGTVTIPGYPVHFSAGKAGTRSPAPNPNPTIIRALRKDGRRRWAGQAAMRSTCSKDRSIRRRVG
jgi:crotonobetainyl-CoA:carnitine CoA-transferase CaiB-like acyl-CoA transferase